MEWLHIQRDDSDSTAEGMMATKPPNRNLPTPAVPWGRWAETNIQNLQDSDTRQAQGLQNNLKAINGSLNALTVQQNTLADQQVALANQQTLLNTNYYSGTVEVASFTIPAFGTGAGTGHSFVVPAGFNRMQISYMFNVVVSTSSSDMISADYSINGSVSGIFTTAIGQASVQTPRTDFTRMAGYTGPVVAGETIIASPYIYNSGGGAKTGAYLYSIVNVSYYIV